MSAVQRSVPALRDVPPGDLAEGEADGAAAMGLRSLLRVAEPRPGIDAVGPGIGDPGALPPGRDLPPSRDWAHLVERLQGAARHGRAIETQAREQDQRVQQLLDRVRVDMRDALDRVRAAETRLRDAQVRAEADALAADRRIRSAEERAEAAELRARAAEAWLARVHETVLAEFDGLPEPGTP